jgi:UDP-N-acetylmuramoyl-tripeptide--D-alanyl-D-alanine ligase
MISRFLDALDGTEAGRIAGGAVLLGCAWAWRRILLFTSRPVVIAITGSVGKTTAKDCLAAILEQAAPAARTRGNANWVFGVARTVLSIRPRHRFAVVEVGAGMPGRFVWFGRVVKPDIVIELAVRRSHWQGFKSLEEIAREKVELARAVPAGGHVILNADDEHVRGMAEGLRGRVHWFGAGEGHEISYEARDEGWPSRLAVRVTHNGAAAEFQTSLIGEHWAPSVVAAVAAARLCGVADELIRKGLLAMEPYQARMQETRLPNGAVFLRDDYKSVPDSFEAAVAVMRKARAKRKIAVFAQTSDSGLRAGTNFKRMARQMAAVADGFLLVGTGSSEGAQALRAVGISAESVHAFPGAHEAGEFLRGWLRDGDLVLLTGRSSEHLARVYLMQTGDVNCRLATCPLHELCDHCGMLGLVPFPAVTGARGKER